MSTISRTHEFTDGVVSPEVLVCITPPRPSSNEATSELGIELQQHVNGPVIKGHYTGSLNDNFHRDFEHNKLEIVLTGRTGMVVSSCQGLYKDVLERKYEMSKAKVETWRTKQNHGVLVAYTTLWQTSEKGMVHVNDPRVSIRNYPKHASSEWEDQGKPTMRQAMFLMIVFQLAWSSWAKEYLTGDMDWKVGAARWLMAVEEVPVCTGLGSTSLSTSIVFSLGKTTPQQECSTLKGSATDISLIVKKQVRSLRHRKAGLKARVVGLWRIAREQVQKVLDYVQKQGNDNANE
ncbi:hypothetical protein EDB19DRAFT_1828700 [Suillus lakei]|nr:hypothetical protein EDB19DRAFT_1828700 [Suillus lakei]